MLAGLEHPTKGEIVIAGKHIEKLNEKTASVTPKRAGQFIFPVLQPDRDDGCGGKCGSAVAHSWNAEGSEIKQSERSSI